MKISYNISFIIVLCGHIPSLMALSDTDGFLYTYGSTAPTIQTSSLPRFVWDGSGSRLQAGIHMFDPADYGNFSLSFGSGAFADGDFSFAFGEYAYAGLDHSMAFGEGANAYSTDSFAFAKNASTLGQSSFAFGENASTFGQSSFALGFSSMSSGTGSVSIGYDTYSSANYAFSSGYQSESMGTASTAMGYMNSVTGGYGSVSMGQLNEVSNNGTSFALGKDLKVTTGGESVFVIGQTNARTSGTAADPGGNFLFVIGNGEPGVLRSDAFSVNLYGDVTAAGFIDAKVPAKGGISMGNFQ